MSRFTTGINDTGGKFAPVSMTLEAKLPPVSTTQAANFSTIFASVIGVNDAGGKLPPVSMTPAANLPPV